MDDNLGESECLKPDKANWITAAELKSMGVLYSSRSVITDMDFWKKISFLGIVAKPNFFCFSLITTYNIRSKN